MFSSISRLIVVYVISELGRVKDFKVYTEGERMEVPDSLDKVHK